MSEGWSGAVTRRRFDRRRNRIYFAALVVWLALGAALMWVVM